MGNTYRIFNNSGPPNNSAPPPTIVAPPLEVVEKIVALPNNSGPGATISAKYATQDVLYHSFRACREWFLLIIFVPAENNKGFCEKNG